MVLFNIPMMYTLWLYQYYKVKAYKAMRGLWIRLWRIRDQIPGVIMLLA